MDPQIRLLHQCCWQTLEHAGCGPATFTGVVDIYAGLLISPHWLSTVIQDATGSAVLYKANILNIHSVTALIVHAFNLTDSAMALGIACSTSAVTTHQACITLRSRDCDATLAGGVSIEMSAYWSYKYHEDMIDARDGVCHPFGSQASGTVTGDGSGMLLLRRLDDALAGRDCTYGVIKGLTINNDGNDKIGRTTPGMIGQSAVIRASLRRAGFDNDSIGLVEAHDTGTALGNPIELRALNEVFGPTPVPFRVVSVLEDNIGHLSSAAGVAGVIKTALALRHQVLPPATHFRQLNPTIDLSRSALYINQQVQPWSSTRPRRALASSFGIGSTNASIALETHQHEDDPSVTGVRDSYLLLSPAKTLAALELRMASTLEYIKHGIGVRLPDMAYALQTERTAFDHRRAYLVSRGSEIDLSCATISQAEIFNGQCTTTEICFMFPGQGSQYHSMASAFYAHQPMFRRRMDHCLAAFQRYSTVDFEALLFDDGDTRDIDQAQLAQPALFCIEHSLARTLIDLGITPDSMIGHSLGECVAACIAGVFTPEDTLRVIEARGRSMQSVCPGNIVTVYLSRKQLIPWLAAERGIKLAANNSAHFCVVVSEQAAISRLSTRLVESRIRRRCLKTSHVFHSAMMMPMLHDFAQLLGQISMHAPHKRFISNVSGTWITEEQTASSGYRMQQMHNTALFSKGVAQLLV